MLRRKSTQPVARSQHAPRDIFFFAHVLIEETCSNPFLGKAAKRRIDFQTPWALYLWRHALFYQFRIDVLKIATFGLCCVLHCL